MQDDIVWDFFCFFYIFCHCFLQVSHSLLYFCVHAVVVDSDTHHFDATLTIHHHVSSTANASDILF